MPLTFPNILPSRAEWQLVSNTQVTKSTFDGSVQTSEMPGAKWHVSLSFPNRTELEGRVLAAFLASLRGESGRFFLHDHTLPAPRGTIAGTPVVSGVAQIGASIITTGWTGTLLAGDMVGLGGELKQVSADVTGNGAAATTITFEPPLRHAPGSGSAVVINKPTAVFKLTGDNQASSRVTSMFYDMSITCEEAY